MTLLSHDSSHAMRAIPERRGYEGSDFAILEENNFEFIFGSSNQELDPLTNCRSF